MSDENRKLLEERRDLYDAIWKACGNPQAGEPWPGRAPAIYKAILAHLPGTRSEPPADLKAAVEALEPFAEACAHLHPAHPDDGETLDGFKVSDFRRAAEVYAALNLSETVDEPR